MTSTPVHESSYASRAVRTHRRRVLLKLSGEVFGGGKIGVDPDVVAAVAREVAPTTEDVEVSIVVGGSIPRGGKLAHILKAISKPVGKLVTADLASFEDDGPARIEILCPAPA